MRRVLVTASRNWADCRAVWAVLDAEFLAAAGAARWDCSPDPPLLMVVHGAGGDGDRMAAAWVLARALVGWPVAQDPHPADWKTLGRRAGMIRNAEMVQAGAEHCYAFIAACTQRGCERPEPHGSHGASRCVEMARAAGISVTVDERTA
jgi:hypothetical protein